MKKFKKLISILISIMVFFSMTACTSPKSEKESYKEQNVTDEYIVQNGQTDYVIVVPENTPSTIKEAASELIYFFKEATNITLEQCTDNGLAHTDENKYISLGYTKILSQAGISASTKELTSEGFKIETKGNSIFVVGGDNFGTLWGVYELLTEWFDYDYFMTDVYTIETNVTNLKLVNYNIKKIPEIEYRLAYTPQAYSNISVAHRLRLIEGTGEMFSGTSFHNSFTILPPDVYALEHPNWYSVDNPSHNVGQLSYTARGNKEEYELMLQASLEYFKPIIRADQKEVLNLLYTILDSQDYCSYDKALGEQYGSISAPVILFLNDLQALTQKWIEEEKLNKKVNYLFFAYFAYEEAPVKEVNGSYQAMVKCAEGVIPFYAPIYAHFTKEFTEGDNIAYYQTLQKWSLVSDEIYMWIYTYNSGQYFYFWDSFEAKQELYKTFEKYNVNCILEQHKHDVGIGTAFSCLNEYLYSKLAWDSNADYNSLIEKYFNACFGPASDIMMDYFNEQRMLALYNINEQGLPGGIWGSMSNQAYWPQKTLKNWLDMFESAYKSIEILKTLDPTLYDQYYNSILLESLAVRYPYIDFYMNNDTPESIELKLQFKADITALGIQKAAEANDFTGIFTSWGIA